MNARTPNSSKRKPSFAQRIATSPGQSIRDIWARLSRVPGGKRIFSKIVGHMAPYTGTIGAQVVDLRAGYAKVQMKDRRAVRNHLNCVHAIALMNLAEEVTGLAMMAGFPDQTRGILSGLRIEYLAKARGLLTAECTVEPPSTNERREMQVMGEIRNEAGAVVARATATWLVGPTR